MFNELNTSEQVSCWQSRHAFMEILLALCYITYFIDEMQKKTIKETVTKLWNKMGTPVNNKKVQVRLGASKQHAFLQSQMKTLYFPAKNTDHTWKSRDSLLEVNDTEKGLWLLSWICFPSIHSWHSTLRYQVWEGNVTPPLYLLVQPLENTTFSFGETCGYRKVLGHWRENRVGVVGRRQGKWFFTRVGEMGHGEKFQEILSILSNQGGVKRCMKIASVQVNGNMRNKIKHFHLPSSGYEKNQLLHLELYTRSTGKKKNISGSANLLEQVS